MKLRQLFEAEGKTAVVAFGRMNPPTIGHAKLVDAIKSQQGDHYVFLSQSQKPKTDPLPFADKLRYAKFFFPEITIGNPEVRTPIQMMQYLEGLGYTDIIYVAGSDRAPAFDKLFNDYNGKDYTFNSIEVVSAGERDPDADGAEGMSASKMRSAAADGDLESFKQGVPQQEVADEMFAAVRKGMGIRDEEPVVAETSNNIFSKIKQKMVDNGVDPKRAEELIMADYAKKSQEMSRSELRQYYEKLGLIPDEKTRMSQRSWLGSGPDYSDDPLNDLFKNEDVSPKDEDKFHNELDDLVHKYFGDSPDEEKMLKKYKKTDEEAPPGREDQVKALKKEFPDDEGAPYAIAWAQHNKKKKKTNESESATYYIVTVHSGGTIKRYKFDGDKFADSNEAADFVTKIFDKKGISVRVKATQYRKKESVSESDVVIDPTQLRQYLRMLIDDAIDKEQDIDKLSKVLKILVGKEIKSRGKRYKITSEDIVNAFEASCNRKKKMREASNPNLERAIALAMGAQNLLQGSLTGGDEMDTTVILSPSAKKKANQMITQAQKLSGLSVEKLIDLGQRQLDKDTADVSAEFNEERSEELPDGSTKDYAADGSYTHSGAWGKKFYDANGKLIKTQTPVVNGLSTIKYADGKARYIFSGGGLEARGPLEGNKPSEADYLSYAFGGARFIFDARKGQPVIKGSITIGRLKVALTGKVLDRPAFHKNPRTMMTQILGGDPLAILKDPMAVKPLLDKGTAKIYLDGKEVGAEQLSQAVEQGL